MEPAGGRCRSGPLRTCASTYSAEWHMHDTRFTVCSLWTRCSNERAAAGRLPPVLLHIALGWRHRGGYRRRCVRSCSAHALEEKELFCGRHGEDVWRGWGAQVMAIVRAWSSVHARLVRSARPAALLTAELDSPPQPAPILVADVLGHAHTQAGMVAPRLRHGVHDARAAPSSSSGSGMYRRGAYAKVAWRRRRAPLAPRLPQKQRRHSASRQQELPWIRAGVPASRGGTPRADSMAAPPHAVETVQRCTPGRELRPAPTRSCRQPPGV
eukprot:scaffold1124_cov131-Isochrysis_galbana.AAC.1